MDLTRTGANLVKALFLLMLLALTVTIFNATGSGRDAIKDKSMQISKSQEMARYAPYDNISVSGSDIRSAVRAFAMDDYFFVYVSYPGGLLVINPSEINNTAPSIDIAASKPLTSTTAVNTTLDQINTETSGKYIRSQSRWTASLLKDSNGTMVGILFK